MSSRRSAFLNLENVARRADKVLATISRSAEIATRLSTSAIYGCIGFTLGTCGMYAVVLSNALAYGVFFVPAAGLVGMLAGVLMGRDRIDRINERSGVVIERAWQLRDREIESLSLQLKNAVKFGSPPRIELLERKLALLQIAEPQQLIDYFCLNNGRESGSRNDPPRLGPPDDEITSVWQSVPVIEHKSE